MLVTPWIPGAGEYKSGPSRAENRAQSQVSNMLNLRVLLVVGTFLLNGGEAAITWTNPTGGAGFCGTTNEASGSGALSVTLTATTDGTKADATGAAIAAYAIVPTAPNMPHDLATLVIGTANGVVSLGSGELFFETGSTFVFTATATDDADPIVTSTATCTVSLTDVNAMPAFAAGVTVFTTATTTVAALASVTTYTATDADSGDTLTYAIASGNTNSDLDVASGTGEITVAAGKTLNQATTATYYLLITATDNGFPQHSITGTLSICVGSCPSGVGSLTIGLLTLFMALMVSFN